MDRFACVSCGFEADADLNAARIIALRKFWRSDLPKDKKASKDLELPEKLQFRSFLRNRAGMRGAGSGVNGLKPETVVRGPLVAGDLVVSPHLGVDQDLAQRPGREQSQTAMPLLAGASLATPSSFSLEEQALKRQKKLKKSRESSAVQGELW